MFEWLEHGPEHRKVLGLSPGQGHVAGLQVRTQALVGAVREAINQGNQLMRVSYIDVSLSLSPLPPFHSLRKSMGKNIYPLVSINKKQTRKQKKLE